MIKISNIKKLYESNKLELKKAKGGFPYSLWENYSSFANSDGGTIILGIDETQKNEFCSSMLTIDEIDSLRKTFWNTVNNNQKVSANILVDKDVFVDEYDGFPVLVINVRRASRFEKPVYINNNVYNGTYRRNHEGDYHCTKQEVDLMIKDSGYSPLDKTALEEFELDDLNKESIERYKQLLSSSNPSHIFLTMNDEQFYLNLGVAKKGSDGKIHPTRAGILMFGNEYRITDEFPHYFLDYQDHRKETSEIRWIDRIYSSSGDWSGNVFDFFIRVYNKLVQDIPVPFNLDRYQRVEDTLMHKALREALCNALCNADYYGTRGVVINKYQDRIVIANPGCMRISIDEAFAGGNSDPRNETVLKMFNLIKIGERDGTGIQTILYAIKQNGFRPLTIEETFNPDRTKLVITLKKENQFLEEPIRRFSSNIWLSKDENKVLELIKSYGRITRLEIEEKLEFGKTKSNSILNSLIKKDFILKVGNGRSTEYLIK